MTPTRQGSFKLFRLSGITVYLHWSWFVVAFYQIDRTRGSWSYTWSALEYLALFMIVLMHEFGHSLACRSVGGKADQIVLWPLGGVAYVAPPQRPGATLWSIAAGPLVNVALTPIFITLWVLSDMWGWAAAYPEAGRFIQEVSILNLVLLALNMLPIFPLDGGQILRALLWYPLGRARSLIIATVIGFFGVLGLVVVAIWMESIWYGVMCVFILLNCGRGFLEGITLLRIARLPRREQFACPACKSHPPAGEIWKCGNCRQQFDIFSTVGVCPRCGAQFHSAGCFECGELSPISAWIGGPVPPVALAGSS